MWSTNFNHSKGGEAVFIIRLWRYCRGYLVILLRGRGVERLLNLAIARGVTFWDLRKNSEGAQLSIPLDSFKALRPLVRQTHCKLHIQSKVGLPFWSYRLRRRWGLVMGLLLFLTALYLATSVIWTIRVSGNQELEHEEVLKLAEELGIKLWVWKRTLNLPELEDELSRRHGDIAWAGIRVKGTLLEIEIVEHLPEPKVDRRPADLVATKDGVIERVLVLEGEAVVAPGDTVIKGDLLVQGCMFIQDPTLPPEEQPPPLEVRAKGEVEARVWYEGVAPINEKELLQKDTGNSGKGYYLRWPDGNLKIWGFRSSPFDISRQEVVKWSWRWRNLSLPVEVITVTYFEIIQEIKTLSPQEALQQAREEALSQLREQLPEGVDYSQIYFQEFTDQGKDWVRAVAETREDIAEIRLLQP